MLVGREDIAAAGRQRAIVWSVGPDGAKQSGEPPANLVWSVKATYTSRGAK